MHCSRCVPRRKSFSCADSDVESFLPRQGAAAHVLVERLSFQKWHHDKEVVVVVANFEYRADAGMPGFAGGKQTLQKALALFRAVQSVSFDELEGDQPSRRWVLGFVDAPHAAGPQVFKDGVFAQLLADHISSIDD